MSEGSSSLDEKLKDVKIPYHILDYSDNRFTEEERKYLERQLRSMFAFIGCAVPERIVYQGAEIPVRDTVWKLLTKDELTQQERVIAEELVSIMDRKVKENQAIIEKYALSDEEAEKLYFEACGMLKAIVSLRSLEKDRTAGIEELTKEEKIKDAKRLLELLEKIKV